MPESADLPTAPAAKLPATTLDFLHGASLTLADSPSDYDALIARLFASVRPSDPLEEIWTREVGDDVWEAVRNRRLKAALMTACADQGVMEVLSTLQVPGYFELAKRWSAREPDAIVHVEAILAKAGLTMSHVLAQTQRRRIKDIERFDGLIEAALARRNATLHEIAQYRAHFAKHLRRVADEADTIEDVAFSVVAPTLLRQNGEEAAQAVAETVA
jgi:SH3-like domain-containing protein